MHASLATRGSASLISAPILRAAGRGSICYRSGTDAVAAFLLCCLAVVVYTTSGFHRMEEHAFMLKRSYVRGGA